MSATGAAQALKCEAFRGLHLAPGAFIMANAFDRGSARILETAGFAAIATSSAGWAFSNGRSDRSAGLDSALKHIGEIVASTGIPVSADLEQGFADEPDAVADAVSRAAATGIAGCSIEDSTGRAGRPLYPVALAAERIAAAAEAARSLKFPFMLTARAENFLGGDGDLGDAIRRVQAYQEAGADVLYIPGLTSLGQIEAVLGSIDRPLNVLAPCGGLAFRDLEEAGVKRVSVGSAIARAAYGAVAAAGRELRTAGTFDFARQAIPFREIDSLFAEPPGL